MRTQLLVLATYSPPELIIWYPNLYNYWHHLSKNFSKLSSRRRQSYIYVGHDPVHAKVTICMKPDHACTNVAIVSMLYYKVGRKIDQDLVQLHMHAVCQSPFICTLWSAGCGNFLDYNAC